MYLTNPYVTRHPYQTVSGRRAAVMDYLVGRGVNPVSVGAQLCALGVITTQYLANICWPNGQPCVIGTPTILIERSSSGKTLLSNWIIDPARRYLDTLDFPGDSEPIAQVEDATRESIIDALAESSSAVLVSTEGAMVVRLLRTGAPWLAKLLDGEGLRHSRRSLGPRVSIDPSRRFTVQITLQPGPAEEYGDYVRSAQGGAGTQNRFTFFVAPDFTLNNVAHNVDPSAPALNALVARSMELIDMTVKSITRKSICPNLRLSKDAEKFLKDVDAEARAVARVQPHTCLRDYLVRHAERVLRESGSHHVYEHGPHGEVMLETVQMADQFARASFDAFQLFTYRPRKPTKQEVNAQRVDTFIQLQARLYGTKLSLANLRAMAPNAGLTRAQFDSALPLVCVAGKAYVEGKELHVNTWWTGNWPRLN